MSGAMSVAYGLLAFGSLQLAYAEDSSSTTDPQVHLELTPRICTLSAKDKQCEATVTASWRAEHDESLCVVILQRTDIKHCWEHYSQGTYSMMLVFADDLVVQLKDLALQRVLASETLRVIREALLYRHKRREPWNIFG
jgi:hypothetical protein